MSKFIITLAPYDNEDPINVLWGDYDKDDGWDFGCSSIFTQALIFSSQEDANSVVDGLDDDDFGVAEVVNLTKFLDEGKSYSPKGEI